jgi:hypothetical protein
MTTKHLLSALTIFIIVSSTFSNYCVAQERSKVISFNYGGYGDNIYATLYGQIYSSKRQGSTDSLVSLQGVKVVVTDSLNIVYKIVKTDKGGNFRFELKGGKYKVAFEKTGFQPLTVYNYESHPDQVSDLTILLYKGNKRQDYTIAPWTQN